MKRIENRFWSMLEASPRRIATKADWQRGTGSEYALFEPMFYPVKGLARNITDPDDINGPSLSVVDYGNDKFGAIDEGLTRRIPLTLEDIIRYTLNFNDFRHLLCQVLGFEPGADVMPSTNVDPMRFGTYPVKPGVEFPVYMILARDEYLMLNLVLALLATEKNAFLLLTATRFNWTQEIQQLVHDRQSQIVSLEECLMVDDGRFVKSKTWDNAVNAFRSVHFPENMVEVPPYEFRKKGEMWVIRFAGEDMYLKDSIGLRCIGQLLAKPNDPVFVLELRAIMDGQNPDAISQPQNREEVVDRETLSGLKQKYLELQSDLVEAQREGNELAEKEIEQEMEGIVQYLYGVKSLNGETRKVSDSFEKARSATSKAFWRSVNLIRDESPQFATHLEKSCTVGVVCNYNPEQVVDWTL